MANGVEAAGFCLPSEFLTDEDFLIDKQKFNMSMHARHFQTQTNHLLQKFYAMSTLSQSSLRSPSRALSLSQPNKYNAVEDLIYLSSSGKLKLNRGYAMSSSPQPRNSADIEPRKSPASLYLYTTPQFENIGARAARGTERVAWAPYQIPNHGRAATGGGGAATKKAACAGTGVFLPRRYENISERRPGCNSSSAQIHTKPMMYDFYEPQQQPRIQPQPDPKISSAFVSDYDSALARRHALVLLQQRHSFLTPAEGSSMISRDHPCLPQEWTY